MKRFVLGIAGAIGSGKTTAGNFLQKQGAEFIDADEVVNQLYQKGKDGYRKIMSFFGEEYFNKAGELNRKKFAKVVFGDPKKLRILHDLIHPLVTSQIQKMIDQSKSKFIVVEATYFEKKHLQTLVDKILWIDVAKPILLDRLEKNRGMERPMVEKILRLQVKPSQIDFLVENNGSVQDFESEILKIWEKLQT